MDIINLDKLNLFKKYISSIKKEDNLAIIYDTDMDGITSAVITSKALDKLNIKYFQRPRNPKNRTLDKSIQFFLKENKINKIIFLDLSAESFQDSHLLNNYDVLVIDHHPILENYNINFKIIKSFQLQDKLEGYNYCTAHMVFDLFSSILDLEDLDWVLACGIIGDVTYDSHIDLLKSIFKKYNLTYNINPYFSDLGQVIEYSNYALTLGTLEEVNKIYSFFYNSNNYKQVYEKLDYVLPIKKEFEKFISNFEKNKEVIGDIVFYEIKSKYNLHSLVSTYISLNLYFGILICIDIKQNRCFISARCQKSKFDLGKMLKECTSNLENAFGGGHPVAAGASININDLSKFKENVLNWINSNY
ncbi:MAG: DHH family phosphoesterase [Candidatus ainarchaeum sp.]|nr:DHH family phosphoesterase [Candidatus ainarchaeum sp.]MDD3975895.1 DHH family phosphoesterase [Candidatus ainarchaeum sp.]